MEEEEQDSTLHAKVAPFRPPRILILKSSSLSYSGSRGVPPPHFRGLIHIYSGESPWLGACGAAGPSFGRAFAVDVSPTIKPSLRAHQLTGGARGEPRSLDKPFVVVHVYPMWSTCFPF